MTLIFKAKICLAMLIPICLFAGKASATKIHQEDGILPNHSCDYVRTLNRFASTDADAAFYNPAGLVFLDDGWHVMGSNQTINVEKTHTMDYYAIQVVGVNEVPIQTFSTRSPFTSNTPENPRLTNLPDEYTSSTTSPVFPDFDVIYKKDRWAAYFDFSVMQATPGTVFPDGAAIIDWGNLAIKETECANEYGDNPTVIPELRGYYRQAEAERQEMFLGATFGGSYRFSPSWSVGGGVRIIHASGRMTLDVTDVSFFKSTSETDDINLLYGDEWHIDTEYEGLGLGFITSFNYTPSDRFHAALKCEYYTPLELDKTTRRFTAPDVVEKSGNLDIFKDGSPSPGNEMVYQHGNGSDTQKATYPPTLALGLSYGLLDDLTLDSSLELSFRNMVDLDGLEDNYRMGYRCGLGLRYALTETIESSIGYLFTDYGIKADKRTESDMLLSNHSIGAGFGFTLNPRTALSIGAMIMLYDKAMTDIEEFTDSTDPTWHSIRKDFKEQRFILGVGITMRFD